MANRKKRILILTADAGYGHRSAANALQEALLLRYRTSVKVEIINPLDDKRAPMVLRDAQTDYDKWVRKAPELYKFGYEASDNPLPTAIAESALTIGMFELMRDLLRTHRPDVVVSTYPLYQPALTGVLAVTVLPEHDGVQFLAGIDAHRVDGLPVGPVGHDGVGAERQDRHDVHPALEVGPGDADLQVVEALREARRPVLPQDLPRVDLGREELRDTVAVNRPVGEVGDPLPPVDVEGGLAVRAGEEERPIRPGQDDPDLLAEFPRELTLRRGLFPAGGAL